MNLLDGGILISMNFFQKNVLQALNDFQQIYILHNGTYSGDYFIQDSFTELDKMLIYMFKIFQQLQVTTFSSYTVAV